MDQLESVGTTPSHIAVSDRADAHRSSSDNPKSGRRARHGVSTTGCPSIVGLFPDTLELGSNPIRPVSLQTSFQLTQNPSYKSPPRKCLRGTARPPTLSHSLASSTRFKTRRAVRVIHLLGSPARSRASGLTFFLTAPRPLPGPSSG